MDMPHRLAGIRAGVENNPVTVVSDAFRDCDLMGVRCHGGQQALIGRSQFGQIGVVRPRDNEHVNRCLRIDIAECDRPLVTRHYIRRNLGGSYGAKQAVRHADDLNVCQVPGAADIYGCTTANPRCTTPLVQRPRQFLAPSLRDESCAGADAKAGMWAWGEVRNLMRAGRTTKHRQYPS
jgi:hypothetical protein